MTSTSGWVLCTFPGWDAIAASQTCTVTWPNINTTPTATQGSGTVDLNVGDLSTLSFACTHALKIIDLTLDGASTA